MFPFTSCLVPPTYAYCCSPLQMVKRCYSKRCVLEINPYSYTNFRRFEISFYRFHKENPNVSPLRMVSRLASFLSVDRNVYCRAAEPGASPAWKLINTSLSVMHLRYHLSIVQIACRVLTFLWSKSVSMRPSSPIFQGSSQSCSVKSKTGKPQISRCLIYNSVSRVVCAWRINVPECHCYSQIDAQLTSTGAFFYEPAMNTRSCLQLCCWVCIIWRWDFTCFVTCSKIYSLQPKSSIWYPVGSCVYVHSLWFLADKDKPNFLESSIGWEPRWVPSALNQSNTKFWCMW